MSDYILSCSSTVDLTPQQMKERNLRYVCFHFILDGQDHKDDMGQSIAPEELYSRMVAGAEAKTSQVALGEYTEYFEQLSKHVFEIRFLLTVAVNRIPFFFLKNILYHSCSLYISGVSFICLAVFLANLSPFLIRFITLTPPQSKL